VLCERRLSLCERIKVRAEAIAALRSPAEGHLLLARQCNCSIPAPAAQLTCLDSSAITGRAASPLHQQQCREQPRPHLPINLNLSTIA